MKAILNRFENRTAIVTGGASGLGLDVAKRIAAEGGRVVIWDADSDAISVAAHESVEIKALWVDVTNPVSVAEVTTKSLEFLQRVDILVNSAGITGATAPTWEFPINSWLKVLDVNLNGVFYCCRAIVPTMIEKGYGRIINIASVAGKEGNPNASAYSASKAGVIALTKSLAKELATKGVLVNALTPAVFETPLLRQMPQTQVDFMRAKIPMGRLGDVDESTSMVCFMASEECSFTTGAIFDTSGGRTTY